jgi:hypothetical protein
MKFQRVVHASGSDSACGYDSFFDLSESILVLSCESIDDIHGILRDNGIAEAPHTILYGGHVVQEFENAQDHEPLARHRTILAVPKDPVVRVCLPDRVWESSVENYKGTMKDLKDALSNLLGSSSDKILLLDTMGEMFNETTSLLSAQCFDELKPLIARTQIPEYFPANSASDRMSSVLNQARSLQGEWCALGNISVEVEKVRQQISDSLESAWDDTFELVEDDITLKAFTFDRFKQDFPTESPPVLTHSDQLNQLKAFAASYVGKNSACPLLAQKIVETLASNLNRTNLYAANQSASLIGTLKDTLVSLADKRPMVHDHEGYHEKLKVVERSLNNYKNIMAGKMLSDPEEREDRNKALHTLREVLDSCRSLLKLLF